MRTALAALELKRTAKDRANLKRFGIVAENALGVSMANIQAIAKSLGRDHDLATALWSTGCYEARLMTAYVGDPERVPAAQMDRWCRDCDNWAVVDTLCFALWDRSPHAWNKIEPWSKQSGEFQKRAAFALLACLALHDKDAGDEAFRAGLRLVELAAADERNFVKKAVNWALRAVGRRNAALHAEALALSRRLAAAPDRASRWVGKGALRELTSPLVIRQIAARRTQAKA